MGLTKFECAAQHALALADILISSCECLQGRAGVSSIQWGGWAGSGMAGADSSTAGRLARMGMPLIAPAQGLAALAKALTSPCHLLTAVPFAWNAFLKQASNSDNPAYADFVPADQITADASTAVTTDHNTSWNPHSSREALTLSRDVLLSQIALMVDTVVGHAVGLDEPLMAAGLDSLGTVELRNTLEAQLGLQLPATLVFDYPSINALADLLYPKLAVATAAAAAEEQLKTVHQHAPMPAATLTLVPQLGSSTPLVAVTAMVVKSPQAAATCLHGIDAVATIPMERWDTDLSISSGKGGMPSRFAAFLSKVDTFDAGLFGVGGAEAILMDPQQRLLLETMAEAQLGSGRGAAGPCGVFVGVSASDYQKLTAQQSQDLTGYNATSTFLRYMQAKRCH